MMKRVSFFAALGVFVLGAAMVVSAVKVGDPAPAFTATDDHGKSHKLSDFKGKFVVLEWHNQGCPYVRKHYNSGNMQKLQREWTGKDVVWLTVISSAPGQQGHVTPQQSQEFVKGQKAAATAVLLDSSGEVGRAYDAVVSPHMFVINPDGVVIYNGAIDDKPTSNLADVETATNYVSNALTEAMAGKPVTKTTSQPYGCGIKYAK